MAREPVVAVDFLGLGMLEREIDFKTEDRGKLVKATAEQERSPLRGPAGDDDNETLPRLGLGTDSSHIGGPLTFSLTQPMPWDSVGGKAEDTDRGGLTVSTAEEKRVEELSDADIMQLSGDECRRYILMIKKEREMPHSAPIPPSIGQSAKSRFLLETGDAENFTKSRGGSSIKNVLLDPANLSAQPESTALQHDIAGPSSASEVRNIVPVPWQCIQSRVSLGEEVYEGVCPSERAVQTRGSNVSPLVHNNRDQSPTQSSAFGSPSPNYLRIFRSTEHSQRPLQANLSGQGSSGQVGVMSRSTGLNHLPGRPPTAQLTIFYSGIVNVYDGVPADKAQAIMLLAGSGSSWSSSIMNPTSVSVLPSTGGMASLSNSPARPGPVSAVASISKAGPVTSPLVPTIAVTASLKQVGGTPTLHAELPQARKASLARFLEKRKDRVRGKAPYVPPIFSVKKDIGSSTPREKSPSPVHGDRSTRSPSPANAVPKVHTGSLTKSPSPARKCGPYQLNIHETASPKPQLVTLVQGLHPTSSEGQDSTSAPHRPSLKDGVDWKSERLPHLSPREEKPEALDESGSLP